MSRRRPKRRSFLQFVDFNCPFCDEALHMAAESAGKRVPCPECKRIVKVPELKKIEKADWRKTNAQGLPSGARRPDAAVPEGAWGTASAGTVSREALEEADVLPDRYQVPLTVHEKVARGIMIFVAVAFVFILVGVAYSWWSLVPRARTLKTVEDYANSPAATEKIGREGVAALYVAIGEYYLRANKPSGPKEEPGAQTYFARAIDALTPQSEGAVKESERDALLADIALLQTDLGGSKDEVDQMTRLSWRDTQGAIGKTLRAMKSPDARLEAFRAVSRQLDRRAKKEVNGRYGHWHGNSRRIAHGDRGGGSAVAGLELLAANQKPAAEAAAKEAWIIFRRKEDQPQQLTPSVVAAGRCLEFGGAQLGRAANQEKRCDRPGRWFRSPWQMGRSPAKGSGDCETRGEVAGLCRPGRGRR